MNIKNVLPPTTNDNTKKSAHSVQIEPAADFLFACSNLMLIKHVLHHLRESMIGFHQAILR